MLFLWGFCFFVLLVVSVSAFVFVFVFGFVFGVVFSVASLFDFV